MTITQGKCRVGGVDVPAKQEGNRQLRCIVPRGTVATTVDVYVIADNQQALPGLAAYSYGVCFSSI